MSTWRGKPSPFHHTSLNTIFEPGSEEIQYCNCSKDGDCKDDQQGSTERHLQGLTQGLILEITPELSFRSTLTVNTGNALCVVRHWQCPTSVILMQPVWPALTYVVEWWWGRGWGQSRCVVFPPRYPEEEEVQLEEAFLALRRLSHFSDQPVWQCYHFSDTTGEREEEEWMISLPSIILNYLYSEEPIIEIQGERWEQDETKWI